MYDLDDVLPDAEIGPGTNLLISGPPMTGKRRVAFQILARGTENGEGVIVVSTKDGAEKVFDEYGSFAPDIEDAPVGIVDCVTKQQGAGDVEDSARVKYASSPVDMTGIGIKLSEFLEEFYDGRGVKRNRILLHSISTLLMYSNLQTVFRFLHVFTGRVQSADALGLYVIDSTAHDDQTMNTLKQLFDGVIEVDEDEAGEQSITTAGIQSV
ncbi:RAD55 family ATPase [Salinarchaeum laminariae]|uniref:RAD55 family ATPase n=1 Tax=Salinarchaeum laminariae TaxID=869888 RepID=UPI0020C00052|nr:ATPase domain-containing protein [Salinarchaeum laminariae]